MPTLEDAFTLAGTSCSSRLLMGTANYPSPDILKAALQAAGVEIITLSLRREAPRNNSSHGFWDYLRHSGYRILPNTAGCRSAQEAVTTAMLGRELFGTHWVKLEVIGNDRTLAPDPFGLVEATEQLIECGFEVFPYTTEDLTVARRLVDLGCRIIMPWGSPIGSGQGIMNPQALKELRRQFPDVTLILDAGIGKVSHATLAMELGFDGVLLNTAIAHAEDPIGMASAFAQGVHAGRLAYRSGLIEERSHAQASTPEFGRPFSPGALL